jgi:hypothetical protein
VCVPCAAAVHTLVPKPLRPPAPGQDLSGLLRRPPHPTASRSSPAHPAPPQQPSSPSRQKPTSSSARQAAQSRLAAATSAAPAPKARAPSPASTPASTPTAGPSADLGCGPSSRPSSAPSRPALYIHEYLWCIEPWVSERAALEAWPSAALRFGHSNLVPARHLWLEASAIQTLRATYREP